MEERAAAAAGIKMVCSRVAFGVRWSEPVRQARLRAFFAVVQTNKKINRFCILSRCRGLAAKDFLSDAASRAYLLRYSTRETRGHQTQALDRGKVFVDV